MVRSTAARRDGFWVVAALSVMISAHACADISTTSTSTANSGATTSVASVGSGTGGGGTPASLTEARIREVLAHLSSQVIAPTYEQAAVAAAALDTASKAYAADPSEANRESVQQAWRDAMTAWQAAELMQVGPAGVSADVLAGEDLRDEIYSWPLLNGCRVEQEIVEGNYSNTTAYLGESINVRGLDAAEQLLFDPSTTNSCPPQNPINEMSQWDAIVGELPQKRADYASTLSLIVSGQLSELSDKWKPSGGDFASTLATAGDSSAVYTTALGGLNAVSDAMFYFEKVTKDLKLGKPLGLINCEEASCADDFESPYALADKAHVQANIAAFRLLLTGGTGDALGFDDLLTELGAEDLATAMTAGLDDADAALAAVSSDSLREAMDSDEQSVLAVFDAVKVVTDILKGEFVDTLGLELPKSVQSDND